jgi:hypothetical protein
VDWDDLWEDLVGVAKTLDVQSLGLDVNAPAMHECYVARWTNPATIPEEYLWRLEIPVFGGHGVPIGRLTVAGRRHDDQPLTDTLLTLTKIVETAENRATEMTAPAKPAPEPLAAPTDDAVTARV